MELPDKDSTPDVWTESLDGMEVSRNVRSIREILKDYSLVSYLTFSSQRNPCDTPTPGSWPQVAVS